MANHQKQWVRTVSTVHCISFNCPRSHFSPPLHVCLSLCIRPTASSITPVTLHAPSYSRRSVFIGMWKWETAGPLQFCINLHLSQTTAALTSLLLVTTVINTIWAQDLSSHCPPATALLWTGEAHTALTLMLCRARMFPDQVKWRPMRFHDK